MMKTKPVFFSNQLEFRQWLEKNHDRETELFVGFYKVNSDRHNMTWSQSVDQALCFGWIDGVRRSIDEESYCIRFTPRRTTSKWSKINIDKVESLIQQGLMTTAGLKRYQERKDVNSQAYSYENGHPKLPAAFKKVFKENKVAWDFFEAQAPSYKKTINRWIMDARQESTRYRRLEKAIKESESGKRIF